LERIRIQGAQSDKVAAANMVIHNTGSYEDLWEQISTEWKKMSPGGTGDTIPSIKKTELGEFSVQRGRPRDSAVIAEIITRLSKGQQKMKSEDIMAQFGDKAYLLLKLNNNVVGLAGWQVENLVARTTDLYLEDSIDPAKALNALVKEVERASGDLQAEASLLFPSLALTAQAAVLKALGYEPRTPDTLGVQAWQDAADESMPKDGAMFFKQLRQDRVLRPI
jgi:dephospho-CoA kinase